MAENENQNENSIATKLEGDNPPLDAADVTPAPQIHAATPATEAATPATEAATPATEAATPATEAATPATEAPSESGAAYPVPARTDAASDLLITGYAADAEMRRLSRRGFLWAGLALVGAFAGQRWLNTRRQEDGVPWPLRRSLEINDQIARDYFQGARLSPTFPRARASEPRANGDYGLGDDFDPADWKLSIAGLPDAEEPLMVTLDDLKKLPKTEMTTELKCIEGWSVVVHWAGVRFADVMAHYWPKEHPISEMPQYVAMETPDAGYYVGLDRESAMHPQTLLCYEMNGADLTDEHGAPLRLAIPVKYGIKNIKRIGTIRLTDARPKDYWAEQGYDWYAGH